MWHPTGNSILLVARGADPVGTGREVEVAATSLAAFGGQVHVAFTSVVGSLSGRLAARGVAVHELGRRSQPDAAVIGRLVKLIRLVQPGTVLTFGRPQAVASAVALPFARIAGRRPRLVCRVAVAPQGLRKAWAVTRADRVIASSESVAEACRKAGVARHRLDIIEPIADAVSPRVLAQGGGGCTGGA